MAGLWQTAHLVTTGDLRLEEVVEEGGTSLQKSLGLMVRLLAG